MTLSSEELVERVARIIREPGLGYSIALVRLVGRVSTYLADVDGDGPREFPSYGDALDHAQNLSALAKARAVLAALPDISSLQGEVERLRKLLDNSSQSQPVFTPSGQPNSEPSGAWRTDFENAPLNQRVLLWCSDLLGEMAFDARVGRPIRQPIGIKFGAVRRYEGCDRSAHGEGMNGPWVFTHWMPLPEPPVASREAESSPPSSERASSRDEPETPNPEPSAS